MQVKALYQTLPKRNTTYSNALNPTVRAPTKQFFTKRKLSFMSSS